MMPVQRRMHVIRIAAHGLQASVDIEGNVNPIAMLTTEHVRSLPLGMTEWKAACASPDFATVVALPESASGPLHLQIRHVGDPFWDAAGDAGMHVHDLPIIGCCSFTLDQAHTACEARQPLELALAPPNQTAVAAGASQSSGDAPFTAPLGASVRLTVVEPAADEPWSLANTLTPAHSVINYGFGGGGRPCAELRVAEHMIGCSAGYSVPRAVLTLLRDDAMLHAAPNIAPGATSIAPTDAEADIDANAKTEGTAEAGGGGSSDEADPSRVLARLSPPAWRAHLGWLEQTLAQLRGAFQHEHGFKASSLKGTPHLGAMTTNLQLNVLDVLEVAPPATVRSKGGGAVQPGAGRPHLTAAPPLPYGPPPPTPIPRARALHATISAGAFAAHSLGFGDGGAAEHEARLAQLLCRESGANGGPSGATPVDALLLPYAQRLALLCCQACGALAASFVASCRLRAAAGDVAWFAQLRPLGYLLHVESLLTTRGEEWAMLQDVQVACRLLSRVRLRVRTADDDPVEASSVDVEDAASPGALPVAAGAARGAAGSWQDAGRGVRMRGTRARPVLEFSARDLGFRDAAHAATMGLAPGSGCVSVHAVLMTQVRPPMTNRTQTPRPDEPV